MDLKIALVNPRMEGPYPPLGLGYIAAYLKKYGSYEYEIKLFDGNTADGLGEKISAFAPDLVGFTGHSPQIREAVRLSKEIRAWRPGVVQLIGGVHVSADPVGTLKKGSFDLAVLGEGEMAFLELVETMAGGDLNGMKSVRGVAFQDNGKIIINERMPQIPDLDTIPPPARDLFDMAHYLAPSFGVRGVVKKAVTSITSSRGCPYECTFCGVSIVFKKVRHFSRDYTVAEIDELAGRYGVRALYFADDTFVTNKKNVAGFCERLISTGLSRKVSWTAQARANLIDHKDVELLKLMKAAGCIQLEYGFESGSDRVLGLLKQNRVTVEENQRAIDVTKKAGLRVLGTFIVGTPGETEAELAMTREFVRRNINKLDYFQAFICTPFPGSPLYETCLEKGLVNADYFVEDERRARASEPTVFTDTIPHERVREELKHLDYLGIKKVSLKDKALWVLYHIAMSRKDVSHHDRLYIFRRLVFYFASIFRPSLNYILGRSARRA